MVFIVVGVGGGIGIGVVLVIVCFVWDIGVFIVGIVIKFFIFEGSCWQKQVEQGIEVLVGEVDILIVILNDCLFEVLDQLILMVDVFQVVDDVFCQGVQGIFDLVILFLVINFDFVDVCLIMFDVGWVLFGIGMGSGLDWVLIVVEKVISLFLFEILMDGVKLILFLVIGGFDFLLIEVFEVVCVVGEVVYLDVNIIFGVNIDDDFDDQVWIIVVVICFDSCSIFVWWVECSEGSCWECVGVWEFCFDCGELLLVVGGGDIFEFLF